MGIFRLKLLFFSLIFLLSIQFACVDPQEAMNSANTNKANTEKAQAPENPNSPQDDIDELGELINLPYLPQDCVFLEEPLKEGRRIRAIIRFRPDDAEKLIGNSAPGAKVDLAAEKWFPEELIAQSDIAGDHALHGDLYPADAFFNETFTKGNLTKLKGSDYFALELTNF